MQPALSMALRVFLAQQHSNAEQQGQQYGDGNRYGGHDRRIIPGGRTNTECPQKRWQWGWYRAVTGSSGKNTYFFAADGTTIPD
jgi:hypothetical protein